MTDAGRMLYPPGTAARAMLVELDARPLGNLNPELNASDYLRILGSAAEAEEEGGDEFLERVAKVLDELRGYGRG